MRRAVTAATGGRRRAAGCRRMRRAVTATATATAATAGRCRSRAAGVRRVAATDAVVAVALIAGVVVGAVGHLPLRVLVVGLADATRARLTRVATSGLVAVATR